MYPDIYIASYRINFQAVADTYLPPAQGSMIRGTLGTILKKNLSLETVSSSEKTLQIEESLYNKLFYGLNLGNEQMTLSTFKLPNPYVIKPLSQGMTRFQAGDVWQFQLIVIGSRIRPYTPYYLLAIKEMEHYFLGAEKGQFKLISIVDTFNKVKVDLTSLKQMCGWKKHLITPIKEIHKGVCVITFRTPLRLMKQGKLSSDFNFEDMIKSIMRRGTIIADYYEGLEQEEHYKEVSLEEARHVRIKNKKLKWVKLERYSKFKKERMSLSGVVGVMEFEGTFKHSLYWLELAQWIHIGKACTMGGGWIEYALK